MVLSTCLSLCENRSVGWVVFSSALTCIHKSWCLCFISGSRPEIIRVRVRLMPRDLQLQHYVPPDWCVHPLVARTKCVGGLDPDTAVTQQELLNPNDICGQRDCRLCSDVETTKVVCHGKSRKRVSQQQEHHLGFVESGLPSLMRGVLPPCSPCPLHCPLISPNCGKVSAGYGLTHSLAHQTLYSCPDERSLLVMLRVKTSSAWESESTSIYNIQLENNLHVQSPSPLSVYLSVPHVNHSLCPLVSLRFFLSVSVLPYLLFFLLCSHKAMPPSLIPLAQSIHLQYILPVFM